MINKIFCKDFEYILSANEGMAARVVDSFSLSIDCVEDIFNSKYFSLISFCSVGLADDLKFL